MQRVRSPRIPLSNGERIFSCLAALSILITTGSAAAPPTPKEIHSLFHEPRFAVSFIGVEAGMIAGVDEGTIVPMRAANGILHHCHIPPVNAPDVFGGAAGDKKKEKDEKTGEAGRVVLEKALGKQCFIKLSGWWVYEFCFQRWLRQFHQDSVKNVRDEYFLGYGRDSTKFDDSIKRVGVPTSANGTLTLKKDASGTYYSTILLNGTKCTLTGDQRQTEVRFYCHSEASPQSNHYFSIDEPSTCSYTLSFYTTHVCNLPEFREEPDAPPETIRCWPVHEPDDHEEDVVGDADGEGKVEGERGRGHDEL